MLKKLWYVFLNIFFKCSEGCKEPKYKGDGLCDDPNNKADCDWDGGDCCSQYIPDWNKYCFECECFDPNGL